MELIQIDLKWLETKKININQYLTLLKLYQKQDIPYNIHSDDLKLLEDEGYIRMKDKGEYNYTMKAYVLFQEEPEEDLFVEFYNIFPHKVPDGQNGYRPTSTKDPNGLAGSRTRKIWHRVVGKKIATQEYVIRCLKAELKYRANKGSLLYLTNIDTWLRQAKWEEWDHLVHPEATGNENTTSSSGIKKL